MDRAQQTALDDEIGIKIGAEIPADLHRRFCMIKLKRGRGARLGDMLVEAVELFVESEERRARKK